MGNSIERVLIAAYSQAQLLFTNTKSPSRIVGFMEPLGTQFQSATADFNGKTTMATHAAGLINSRHKYLAARRKGFGTRMGVRRR
jgi:hypothetical protein